jgi:hypothetical protein
LPTPQQPEALAVPADERFGFDIPQSRAPREHVAQSRHNPPRGIGGASRLNLSLLKECQLLAQEQILGCERAARPQADGDKMSEIEWHNCPGHEAVS